MTRRVLDREIPGIAEAIRAGGAAAGVPAAILSRGIAGLAGAVLIVNLPGSSGGGGGGMAGGRPPPRPPRGPAPGARHPPPRAPRARRQPGPPPPRPRAAATGEGAKRSSTRRPDRPAGRRGVAGAVGRWTARWVRQRSRGAFVWHQNRARW